MNRKYKTLIYLILSIFIFTNLSQVKVSKVYAQTNWLSDQDATTSEVSNPQADEVLPDANQYRYQKEELAAFVHFGPNTFNEIEWGERYGNKTPTQIYRLRNEFQADEMVRVMKEAGFKKLIITAKHHDGFAIWDTQYSDYKATNSTNQTSGEKDVLKIISAAATKYDMNMGLYLSPWDIHEKSYGYYDEQGRPTTKEKDHLDYNDFYDNQLKEILSNPKYGNNGRFDEVWMDGAKGSGANAQDYDFKRWFATIQRYQGKEAGREADAMLFGADAYTTVRWIGNEHGLAAKNTWSKSRVDKVRNTINSNRQGQYFVGFENGNQWTVPEADARITSGWFWGTRKKTPKSLSDLAHMYFNSVGNNSVLLLNIPPNNEGYVDREILDRVAEFGREIKASFATNLAASNKASIKANKIRLNSQTYKPGNLVDKNQNTIWTTNDGENSGQILVEFKQTTSFDIVSIEEAIQYGQRINSYTVEYRRNGGNWQTLDSGQTIGAKRLVRTSVIKADQLRISVSVPNGKVPILSEIGVYKSSKAFELSASAPDGIDVFDITDNNAFNLQGRWNSQEGPQFIGSTNKWSNTNGATLTINFTGSKVYLLGTRDPGHGTADIFIDGEKVETINTQGSPRKVGTVIYTSPDLSHGQHTLRLEVKNKAIGIEAAYVINNNGLGMIGFEENNYTMNEQERKDLKLVRIGGSTGKVTVRVSPNPGSAIQDDYNTELITNVTFEDGETEKTAPVETKRNKNRTGDQNFVAEINAVDNEKLIIGFYNTATITIKDDETPDTTLLRQLTSEYRRQNSEWYLPETWPGYQTAAEEGLRVLANEESNKEQVKEATDAITRAKEALQRRENYTEDDPFFFPEVLNRTRTLEAEFATLHNSGDGEKWPLQISENRWASNNKFINSLNNNDRITIPYYATYPGTYQVRATYRSGSDANKLNWREESGKITEGSVNAGSNNSSVTNTVTFDFVVTKEGEGTLVFYGTQQNSPQLDKLEITLKEKERGEIVNENLQYVLDTGSDVTEGNREINLSLDKHKNLIYTLRVENLSNSNNTFLREKYSDISTALPELLHNEKALEKGNIELYDVSLVDENGEKVSVLQNAYLSLPLKEGKTAEDLLNVYHKALTLTKLNTGDNITEAALNSYKVVGNTVVVKIDNLSPFTMEYKVEEVGEDNTLVGVENNENETEDTANVGESENTNATDASETEVEDTADTSENEKPTDENETAETTEAAEENEAEDTADVSETEGTTVVEEAREETNSQLVNQFKQTHKDALSKTVDNVTIEDEEKVINALNAYNDLSEDVKAKLETEKQLLESLKAKIMELKGSTEKEDKTSDNNTENKKEEKQTPAITVVGKPTSNVVVTKKLLPDTGAERGFKFIIAASLIGASLIGLSVLKKKEK